MRHEAVALRGRVSVVRGKGGMNLRKTMPARGYSFHLGGPWYLTRSPDTGRLYYAKDAGTGTVEIPLRAVPADVRRKGGL